MIASSSASARPLGYESADCEIDSTPVCTWIDSVDRWECDDDYIYGHEGADQCFGGDGYDRIHGGAGADFLDGGATVVSGSEPYVPSSASAGISGSGRVTCHFFLDVST